MLGFTDNEITIDVDTINSITASNVIKPNVPMYIYVCIDNFTYNYTDAVIPPFNYVNGNHIMDVIDYSSELNDNTAYSIITVGSGKTRQFTQPVDLTQLRVYFLNEYGNKVDFNGHDVIIDLEVEQNFG